MLPAVIFHYGHCLFIKQYSMIFKPSPLKNVMVVIPEFRTDERGGFARIFCEKEFAERGMNHHLSQGNIAYNHKKGTLRGMHYQLPPMGESKLVQCTRGSVFDVVIDLRKDSPTYLQHFSIELNADNRIALYVPEMFAHGYLTLTDDVEMTYLVSTPYSPEHERGVRYNDPAFNIQWPMSVEMISGKDNNWALFIQEENTNQTTKA
jgi:dTDP-4-dehydrorhamnose 3,5-epimerase